jgi:integrase
VGGYDDYIQQNVAEKASNLISKYSPPQGIKKHIPITHLPDFLKAFLDASPFHINGLLQKDIDKMKEDNLRLVTETQRDYILFLLLTGLRKEEASSLKWSDVEMDEGRQIFAITITDNKANRPFRFPMTMTLRAMFEYRASLPSRHPVYIFPAKSSRRGSDRGYINDTRKAFLKIQKFAGFEETITPHDIRRTFSTLCNEIGLATAEVGKLLNHANASVTEGYIQRSLDNQRKLYDEYINLIENNLNFYYENYMIEDNIEEETLRYGIKNFFRNHFYGQSYNLVQFNTEPPKPTYWDDYKT